MNDTTQSHASSNSILFMLISLYACYLLSNIILFTLAVRLLPTRSSPGCRSRSCQDGKVLTQSPTQSDLPGLLITC